MARITVQENNIPNISNNDIHKIIDDAMEKRDRTVHILIHTVGISINVYPSNENDGMKWIEEKTIDPGYYDPFTFHCSECGYVIHNMTPHYCPDCGAERTGVIYLEEKDENSSN